MFGAMTYMIGIKYAGRSSEMMMTTSLSSLLFLSSANPSNCTLPLGGIQIHNYVITVSKSYTVRVRECMDDSTAVVLRYIWYVQIRVKANFCPHFPRFSPQYGEVCCN
mmetsp:Transcript_15799/g.17071  ORF Transcript_15799/g.17071 Transcript_15799/m.17071 type:complete len:108 (-) Transcript_15799:293-616(-)